MKCHKRLGGEAEKEELGEVRAGRGMLRGVTAEEAVVQG